MKRFLSISKDLAPGWRVQFAMRLNDTTFCESWGELLGTDQDDDLPGETLHRFRFLQWIDPAAAGSTGPVTYRSCEMLCRDDLAPVRYIVHSAGETAVFRITREQVRVTLATGQEIAAPIDAPDFLLDANMIPQLDLCVRLLTGGDGAGFVGRFLSPSAMQTIEYTLDPTETGWQSSFGETITRAESGGVERVDVDGVEIRHLPFTLPIWADRAGDITAEVPRGYTPPASMRLRETSFQGPDVVHGAALAAPLNGGTAFAAAVYFAGSGRIDRHGFSGLLDLGTHQLLDGLAERGVVSLRYDKRGAGVTPLGTDMLEPSFEGVLSDARAAVAALRAAPESAGLPLYYIGHSQGGLVALILSQEDPKPAGVVLLATVARPIDLVLADQVRSQADKLAFSEDVLTRRLEDLGALFDHVRRGPDSDKSALPPKIAAQRHLMRWYREQLAHDPVTAIRRTKLPILLMRGSKDEQAFDADDRAFLDAAEEEDLDLTYRLLPGLDHLMVQDSGGGLADYAQSGRQVEQSVVDAIADWIAERQATIRQEEERHAR